MLAAGDSAQWTYAAGCPPRDRDNVISVCSITILSETSLANVTISNIEGEDQVSVSPGQPHKIEIDESWETNEGVEDKGFVVTSDCDIQVILERDVPNWPGIFIDATQLFNVQEHSTDFFIISDIYGGQCSSSVYTNNFFLIATSNKYVGKKCASVGK